MRQVGDLTKRVAAIAKKAKSQGPCPNKRPPVPERTKSAPRPMKKLIPLRYPNQDFFICDLFDYALKDDGASMEAPIFTLSTKRDLSSWLWQSQDGRKKIEVYPSIKGRATQFDKDVLIYIVSQMTQALNQGRPDAKNKTVRFRVQDYLIATNKPLGGDAYRRLGEAFDRLTGTRIKTDIRTGGQRIQAWFGIIEKAMVVEKSPANERMIAVEVTLSDWLYNAVQAHEVLTIHRDYFRLRKPLERRLYELARKHCGKQTLWKIGLKLLQEKCGSKSDLKRFRQAVRQIIAEGNIPDYQLRLDTENDQVTVVKAG